MSQPFDLTDRQAEILVLMTDHGYTSKEVAYSLGLSFKTVDTHVDRAILKMGARNRAHALLMLDRALRQDAAIRQMHEQRQQAEAARAGMVHCPSCGGFGFVRKAAS